MDKHILAASVGLNKSIALRRVEPLHRTHCHVHSPIVSKTRNDGDRIPAKERATRRNRAKKPPLGGQRRLHTHYSHRDWKAQRTDADRSSRKRSSPTRFIPESCSACSSENFRRCSENVTRGFESLRARQNLNEISSLQTVGSAFLLYFNQRCALVSN